MKVDEIILVTENWKGTERIFLLNLSDYMEMVRTACENQSADMAEAIGQLYATRTGKEGSSELYFAANKSSQAVFCQGEAHLQCFLLGIHGECREKPVFDEERCTPECLEVLKAYAIEKDGSSGFLHYEEQDYTFRRGEILHNFNGNDYRVLEVLDKKNLILQSQRDGQYIVAVDTAMYERYPKDREKTEDIVSKGIEWGNGVYLGSDFMGIDWDGIMQKYGRPPEIDNIEDYRREARWQFIKLKSFSENIRISKMVRWAAKEELERQFMTTDREVFERNLGKGCYDKGFYAPEKEKTEKSR